MRTIAKKTKLVNAICEYLPYEPCLTNEDIVSGYPQRVYVGYGGITPYLDGYTLDSETYGGFKCDKTFIYLRSLDTMTKEELREAIIDYGIDFYYDKDNHRKFTGSYLTFARNGVAVACIVDFFRSRLLDYRDLIGDGLALPAKEGMYKFEK